MKNSRIVLPKKYLVRPKKHTKHISNFIIHKYRIGAKYRIGTAYEDRTDNWKKITKEWFLYGKWHREDGPAIEHFDGEKEWYLHGEKINCNTNEEFLRIAKLKAFL